MALSASSSVAPPAVSDELGAGGAVGPGDGGAVDGAGERGPSLLEDLEMRHDAQRAQVEAIRREMGF